MPSQSSISRVFRRFEIHLIVLCLLLQGCSSDCDKACFTPPASFQFEFVDIVTGENLFTNGTFDPKEISITDDLSSDSGVEFTFISENEANLIQVGSIGWRSEIVDVRFQVSGRYIFNFYVDAERKSEDCCEFTEYKEIIIRNSEFELNTETGIYRILVQ